MEHDLDQAYHDLIGSPVPEDARLFGGGVDAAAELIDGSRVPSTPSYVYISPSSDAEPMEDIWIYDRSASSWHMAADSQVYSDDRGILQVFAVPGNPYRVWVDFGAGKVGMTPSDTPHILTEHMGSDEAHEDIRMLIANLRAEVDSLDGQAEDLDEIQATISELENRVTDALSRASGAHDVATSTATQVSTLEDRVTTLEGVEPCLRIPVMWDMSGEIGSNTSKHRYTNLHDHTQEVTMFYVEADMLRGSVGVELIERDPATGTDTVIDQGLIDDGTPVYKSSQMSHILAEGRQIFPKITVWGDSEGRDITVEVYIQ